MRELGFENISGTPGTAASLTVTAITSPIPFPRLSEVGPLATPIHYTIENSNGTVLAEGVGYSSAPGTFVRQWEFSQYDGTTYNRNPAALSSLPAGCVIYCNVSARMVSPSIAPSSNVSANRWVDPSGVGKVSSTAYTLTAANRDHYFRSRWEIAQKIDAVAVHATAVGTLDLGIYEVDWATGNPGKLLLGWQGLATVAGMNTILLSAATLGAYAGISPNNLPIGDIYIMWNVSSTAIGSNRTQDCTSATDGSEVPDLSAPQHHLYLNRTNNTAFGDSPAVAGRITNGTPVQPILAVRGV